MLTHLGFGSDILQCEFSVSVLAEGLIRCVQDLSSWLVVHVG